MSALAGIVAFAVLFALFAALPRRDARCGACPAEGEGATCRGCPHAGATDASEEHGGEP